MQQFSKVFGIALAGLSMGYAIVLISQKISSPEAALPDELQYVLDSAGWEASSFAQWRALVAEKLIPQGSADTSAIAKTQVVPVSLPTGVDTYFAAVAGGGAPSYNEIALEKNLLYFQRSLSQMGVSPSLTNFFFANGNDGQATVRYLDDRGRERFKPPEVAQLTGAANYGNTKGWFEAVAQADKHCPAFFYFTGHGALNPDDKNNNWLVLWEEAFVSVKELSGWLKALPSDQPFVTMMAQCYSGSFANLIYENGDPDQPVALQTRCGFFATVASRPSVGCTPAVNEADYEDYSSSFFAGLTGRDRTGQAVTSADYDKNKTVSYAEAHAFAKVDEETTDWPISTVEAWLQKQVSAAEVEGILAQPIAAWSAIARPEEQYVLSALSEKLGFDTRLSYAENQVSVFKSDTVEEAYNKRLQMELINVGAEALIRDNQDPEPIAILEKITACEASTW
jgi:hypothetical protein